MVMDNCHKLIMKVETDNWRVEEQEEEEDGEVKVGIIFISSSLACLAPTKSFPQNFSRIFSHIQSHHPHY